MGRPAYVVHHVPGRVRIKVPTAQGDLPFLRAVMAEAGRIPHVERVRANLRTGSVVIEYQPDKLDEFSCQAKSQLGESGLLSLSSDGEDKLGQIVAHIEAEFLVGHPAAAKSILNAMHLLNRAVKEATYNMVDLKLLVPMSSAVLSAAYGKNPNRQTPLWLTLFIFSVNTFTSFYNSTSAHPAASPGRPS